MTCSYMYAIFSGHYIIVTSFLPQIVRGIKFGEYRCDRKEDLAALVAQQYYIEHGHDLSRVSIT